MMKVLKLMKTSHQSLEIKNKYDVYLKVRKVIESCETIAHLMTARIMTNLFLDMYQDCVLYSHLCDILYNKDLSL